MDARRTLLRIYDAALAAADPGAAVERALRREGDSLRAGARSYDLRALRGVQLLALGKAAVPMAAAAARALGDALAGGALVTSRGSPRAGAPLPVREAGHPLPDESSVLAAQELLEA